MVAYFAHFYDISQNQTSKIDPERLVTNSMGGSPTINRLTLKMEALKFAIHLVYFDKLDHLITYPCIVRIHPQ